MNRATLAPMDGLMQDYPLLVRHVAERAETVFPSREIVSVTQEGVERSTYAEVVERARRLASSLERLGVKRGDRVATFGWNSRRHLELYLAVPSMGAVLHTLNIRLFEEDLEYIVAHAEDKVICLDASLAGVMPKFEGVEHEVLMPDGPGEREGALDYEQLVSDGDPGFEFPDFDENSAAAMCYTSGTTGRPKGVVYSHRSTILHSMGAGHADAMGIRQQDRVMPVVPMFHANAWGIPYTSSLSGSALVFPGPRMAPQDIAGLIASEKVTMAAGVPTIWQGILQIEDELDLSSLRMIMSGGSAVPEALIRVGHAHPYGRALLAQGDVVVVEDGLLGIDARLPQPVEVVGDARVRAVRGRAVQGARVPGTYPPAGGLPDRRGVGRGAPGPRPMGRARVLQRRHLAREVHRGRLAPDRRRGGARTRVLHQAGRPH